MTELFLPMLIKKLLKAKKANSIREAKIKIKEGVSPIDKILKKITENVCIKKL